MSRYVTDRAGARAEIVDTPPDSAEAGVGAVTVRTPDGLDLAVPRDELEPEGSGYRYSGLLEELGEAVLDEETIPLAEEQLRVHKRTRETATVRVAKRVETRTETVDEPLLREEVDVERVPVDRVVETPPAIRREEGLTIIPVVEERLVVHKELVLKEEIHLRRRRAVHREPRQVSLRRETVDVERRPGEAKPSHRPQASQPEGNSEDSQVNTPRKDSPWPRRS